MEKKPIDLAIVQEVTLPTARSSKGEAQPRGDVHHQRQRHRDQTQPDGGGDLPTGREVAALGIGRGFAELSLVVVVGNGSKPMVAELFSVNKRP